MGALGGGGTGQVWETLVRWRAEGRRFALLTVVESRGFTPRKPGAHMLLGSDGTTAGSIGGGAIEHDVLQQARTLFAGGGSAVVKRHLTQELGMCCGGEMTVFVEVVERTPRLYLFGAGYIARPLAVMAAACGFEVTVVDDRPEWASPERFPTATVRCQAPEDLARSLVTTADDYAVVVTHDHALDQRLVQLLLGHPLRYLGMIGSQSKQKKFTLRLRARGFGEEEIARLHTPLGLAIGAQTPEEIAVSAVAQLIAVRRGVPVDPGWVSPPGAGREEDVDTEGEVAVASPEASEAPLPGEGNPR